MRKGKAASKVTKRKDQSHARVLASPPSLGKRGNEGKAVAFIYPSSRHEGHWRTVQGFEEGAQESGYRIITLTTDGDYAKDREYILRLGEFAVQGAVLFPDISTVRERNELLRILNECKFPVVLLGDYLPGSRCSAVVSDSFHASYTATAHLLDKGLRRIGFFSNQLTKHTVRDRYRGYCWALQERGITLDPKLILNIQESHSDFEAPLQEPTRLARKYLKLARGAEGVVCAEDFLALGLIAAAQAAGLRVPRDLKVTGMNDHLLSLKSKPALTTYRTFPEREGRKAFELLARMISGKGPAAQEIHVSGELVIRGSS